MVWVHNDEVIEDCAEFSYVEYGGGRFGLRLTDAFCEDSGVYICEVYNAHGDAESWCQLAVSDLDAAAAAVAPRKRATGEEKSAKVGQATSASAADVEAPATPDLDVGGEAEPAGGEATARASRRSSRCGGRNGDRSARQSLTEAADCLPFRQAIYLSKEDFDYDDQAAAERRRGGEPEHADVHDANDVDDDAIYTDDMKLNYADNPYEIPAQIIKGPVSVSTLIGSTVVLEAVAIGRPEPCIRWLRGVSISFFFLLFCQWYCQ